MFAFVAEPDKETDGRRILSTGTSDHLANNKQTKAKHSSSSTNSINPLPLNKDTEKASRFVIASTASDTSRNMEESSSSYLSRTALTSCSVVSVLQPAKSALLQRPARRDGQLRTRSDSLLVHFENEDRDLSTPDDQAMAMEAPRIRQRTPPSSSTTTSSSSCSHHPELAQLPRRPEGRRRPEARHRRFASQLKRNLRALESVFVEAATAAAAPYPPFHAKNNHDARPDNYNGRLNTSPQEELPPQNNDTFVGGNQAYDADKEDEEDSSSTLSNPGNTKRGVTEMKGSADGSPDTSALAKRCRQSLPPPDAENLMLENGVVGTTNSLTLLHQEAAVSYESR